MIDLWTCCIHGRQRLRIIAPQGPLVLGSSPGAFAMSALCRTPTFQTAQQGVYEMSKLFNFCIRTRTINATTFVNHALSNNLGMLGWILSRLTGTWDGTVLTGVVMEGVRVCGIVIDSFISLCDFLLYCNAASRYGRAIVGWRWGEGSFSYVAGPHNPSKPSKNVDKQIPGMKSSPAPGWMCL